LAPGHFLRAVLSNDLHDSFARADEQSSKAIGALVFFLYNDAPSPCWGTREKVEAWIAAHVETRGEEP
jgi:hypothetical protein